MQDRPPESGQLEQNDANRAQQGAGLGRGELADDSARPTIEQEKQVDREDQLALSPSVSKSQEAASQASDAVGFVMHQEQLGENSVQGVIKALSKDSEMQEQDDTSQKVEYAGLLGLPFELLLHIFSILRPTSDTVSRDDHYQLQTARNCLISKATLPSARKALYSRPFLLHADCILLL